MTRTIAFQQRKHNRYGWYHLQDSNYVPPVFGALSAEEWALMQGWFADTEAKFPSPGEISVPGLSMLNGIVGGNEGAGSPNRLTHKDGYGFGLVQKPL